MSDTLCGGWRCRTVNVIDEGNRKTLATEVGTSPRSERVIFMIECLIAQQGAVRALRSR